MFGLMEELRELVVGELLLFKQAKQEQEELVVAVEGQLLEVRPILVEPAVGEV